MDILTLLKANIRHKKGSFASIVLLMVIISMSLTITLSVRDNCVGSMERAHEIADTGDIFTVVSDRWFTEELKRKVETHPLVERVADYPVVIVDYSFIDDREYGNSQMFMKVHDNVKLMKEDLSGYEETVPPLESGEIYVTQGYLSGLDGKVGDKVRLQTIGGEYEVTVKGMVLEPVCGASVIGWKMLYLSDEDFERMYEDVKGAETDETTGTGHALLIHKAEGCRLTDAEFRRQLNRDTNVINSGFGSLTMDMSKRYTGLFPEIISSVLVVFIGMLLVVVFIVMAHSISTGIEMDYVNIGVLKSQGFGKGRIRTVLILQYLSAQLLGGSLGILLAIPFISPLGRIFQPIMAIAVEGRIAVFKSLGMLVGIFLLSGLLLLLFTRKVGKISPVRAISGGRSEIYFDSRIHMPIWSRGLSATLALRQFTSAKRRYAAAVLIVTLLVFFMMTVQVLASTVNSASALESMGAILTDLDVSFKASLDDKQIEEVEAAIEEVSAIEKAYYEQHVYFSLDGEEIMCQVYRNPEVIQVVKGRAPLYDNEIVITDIIAEELGLAMGDEVEIGHRSQKESYIVSGIFQTMNDTGHCFAMSLKGARRLGFENVYYGGFCLADAEKNGEAADMLNKRYGELLEAEANESRVDQGMMDTLYNLAIDAMRAIIFSFSILFALVVVHMVCAKAFLQEKTDIGIYRALGFTSGRLRLQFAIRFLIIAIIGSAGGTTLSLLFSGRLLSTLLRGIGITSFSVVFTSATVTAPIGAACACFFLFAYFSARKIKRVAVKDLVVE